MKLVRFRNKNSFVRTTTRRGNNMAISSWYALLKDGDLVHAIPAEDQTVAGVHDKLVQDARVAHIWPVDTGNRLLAWTTLVEAGAMGANKDRIFQLAALWECTNTDAKVYATRVGCVLFEEMGYYYATVKEFKDTATMSLNGKPSALEALISLARGLGLVPAKGVTLEARNSFLGCLSL
jgi:hypothetical protein